MIANPSHTIVFGDITMIEEGANPPDASGVVYLVQAQDTDLGNPAPVTVALLSLMRVGSLVAYDRTENRQPVLRVTIKADDSDALARGERALQLQCERANTLTWIPPDGAGEASVFDIVWSSIDLLLDDLAELRRERTYIVRLQALPHARIKDPVVTPALPTTPAFTLVDNASALSGSGFAWSQHGSGKTITIASGNIRIGQASGSSFLGQMERTGNIPLSTAGPYLVFDIGNAINLNVTEVRLFGVGYGPLVTTEDLGGGVKRYYFASGSTDVANLSVISIKGTVPSGPSPSSVDIVQVQLADAIPFIGTARQKALSLVPKGSVRTQGSIHVTHASSSLGKVIVYTHPSGTGYLPPLRQWRTAGNAVTPDSSLNSGAREPIGPFATIFRIPVSVLPIGRVEVWAWLRVTAGSLTRAPAYAVTGIVNNEIVADSGGNFPITFAALNTWQLVALGALTSPPIGLGPSGFVQIGLNENSGEVQIDEAYLFATDLGSLTVVDCGIGTPSAGGPSKHLWIDAPSLDDPMGAIYRGHSADRSDSWHAGANATPWGVHDFDPEGTNVFVVTQNALDAATSLEHYRRYHTHVMREL